MHFCLSASLACLAALVSAAQAAFARFPTGSSFRPCHLGSGERVGAAAGVAGGLFYLACKLEHLSMPSN